MGLGLLSFFLATMGMLFIVQGVRLRDAWRQEIDRRCERDEERRAFDAEQRVDTPIDPVPIDPAAFGSDRIALAEYLAQRARTHGRKRGRSEPIDQ